MLLKAPWPAAECSHFVDTFFYGPGAFLVDEVTFADPADGVMQARVDTTRHMHYTSEQRGDPTLHPRHVNGGDLLTITGNLGCLHAYFFHGCRWDEGWVGFGAKIYRADFKNLALLGPPLLCRSVEMQKKRLSDRLIVRFDFEFTQGDKLIYTSEQSAIFTKDFVIPT
ncbi:MAG TPA: hypothetical protein VLC93_04915 [Myxococcota bacterium]|nr:hypothetical protein [Myxococcota bacterium]